MTYAERIEAMAEHIQASSLEPFAMPDGSKVYANICAGMALRLAIVADAACLKALEEPTEEMLKQGMFAVAEFHRDGTATGYSCTADAVYRAAFSKIDRGEK